MKKDVTYYLLLLQGNGGGNGNPLQYFCLENSRGTESNMTQQLSTHFKVKEQSRTVCCVVWICHVLCVVLSRLLPWTWVTFINKPLTLSTPKEKEEEEEEEKEEGVDTQITVKGRTRIHTVGS